MDVRYRLTNLFIQGGSQTREKRRRTREKKREEREGKKEREEKEREREERKERKKNSIGKDLLQSSFLLLTLISSSMYSLMFLIKIMCN